MEIEVEDDGPGVDAEAAPHLFERFYRARSAQPGTRRGMGIGLAIVRGLTEAMGGDGLGRGAARSAGCGRACGLPTMPPAAEARGAP